MRLLLFLVAMFFPTATLASYNDTTVCQHIARTALKIGRSATELGLSREGAKTQIFDEATKSTHFISVYTAIALIDYVYNNISRGENSIAASVIAQCRRQMGYDYSLSYRKEFCARVSNTSVDIAHKKQSGMSKEDTLKEWSIRARQDIYNDWVVPITDVIYEDNPAKSVNDIYTNVLRSCLAIPNLEFQ